MVSENALTRNQLISGEDNPTFRSIGVFGGAYFLLLHATLNARGTYRIWALRIFKGNLTLDTKESKLPDDTTQVMKPNVTNLEVETQAQLLNRGKVRITFISDVRIGQILESVFCIVVALKERHVVVTINVNWELTQLGYVEANCRP